MRCGDVCVHLYPIRADVNVCLLSQNGELTGGVIELETQSVGIARVGKSLFVATMDKTVHSFHVKV